MLVMMLLKLKVSALVFALLATVQCSKQGKYFQLTVTSSKGFEKPDWLKFLKRNVHQDF